MFIRVHANNTVAVRELKNTLIASELSSLNFTSSARAKWLFGIRYPNVVIMSLCDNLDICLSYHANAYFQSQNSVRLMLVRDSDQK